MGMMHDDGSSRSRCRQNNISATGTHGKMQSLTSSDEEKCSPKASRWDGSDTAVDVI